MGDYSPINAAMPRRKKTTRETPSTSTKKPTTLDSAEENEADDEGEIPIVIEISEGEGGNTRSGQSIEQLVKEMIADDSFLKDIKSNSIM